MLIKTKPEIGQIAAVISPLEFDRYDNPVINIYLGVIKDIDKDKNILIDNFSSYVPEWRVEWFTFGGVSIKNPKFNLIKIRNENQNIMRQKKKK